MTDRNLLILCIISSLAGISMIFLADYVAEVPGVSAGSVEASGKTVSVGGIVSSRHYTGKHLFFDLKDDTGKVKVVVFENTIEKCKIIPEKIKNGMEIGVVGKTDTYEGETEIIASEIFLE